MIFFYKGTRGKCNFPLLSLSLLLTVTGSALAGTPDPAANGPVVQGFSSFISRVGALTNSAITQPDYVYWVNLLFLVGCGSLIILTLAKYAINKVTYADVAVNVFLILMVQVMMAGYSPATDAAWSAAEGIASSLQMGLIGTRDAFFAPQFITNLFKSMTFSMKTILNPITAISTAANMVILSVISLLLSCLSYVSIIWGFWGFTIAKLIGLTFIPTLLDQRLSFLFDGWLKFFIGFLVYYIIARLNVVLVACSLALYYNVGIPFSVNQRAPIELPFMASIFDGLGVFTFVIVGVLALFSTGRFAGTIVAGAGSGGMGQAMLGAARAAAKIAKFV